jgi:excisionase family DNA binding protein
MNAATPDKPPVLLKPAEAAPLLGLKTSTIWAWLRDGALPHVKIRGKYYIRREGLLEWINLSETGGQP